MTTLNRTITTLLVTICLALLLFGALVIYQTIGPVRTSDLAVQLLQATLLAGISLWLATYGLWQLIRTRTKRASHPRQHDPLAIFRVEGDENSMDSLVKSKTLESAGEFYLMMTVGTVIVTALTMGLLSLAL